MDAFVNIVQKDAADDDEELVLDVAEKGRAFLLNRKGHLWRADGRLLHLEKSAYYDAHCYELKCKVDRDWKSLKCESLHVHPDGAFALIHATQVRCYAAPNAPIRLAIWSRTQAHSLSWLCIQECGYRHGHVLFLVDANAAVPKHLPKPQRVRVGKEKRDSVLIVHRMICMAQEVDEARIAANRLEVLQVCVVCLGRSIQGFSWILLPDTQVL